MPECFHNPAQETRCGPPGGYEFPEIEGLEKPRPLVHRAIDFLEAFSNRRLDLEETPPWQQSGDWPDQSPEDVQTELRELLHSPHLFAFKNQAWAFQHFLIRRQNPTLLFCRNRSPVANMIFQMCVRGDILSEKLLDGDICERSFLCLTTAGGRLASAPIRICDARDPHTLMRVLLDAHTSFDYAVCDWIMSDKETAAASRLTRDSRITILCPKQEALPPPVARE